MSTVLPPGNLTPHFKVAEMACKCCGLIHRAEAQQLCERLERVRLLVGPLFVLSGTRCQHQNELEGGVRDSAHLTSMAADIITNSDHRMFEIVRTAQACGFRRIGIAARSVHLDIRDTPFPLMWTYYAERR